MPLGPGIRFRVKQTAKGPVRLAFRGNKVIEAKSLKTGNTSKLKRRILGGK